MWFNRKSTEYSQVFAQVEKRLNHVERELLDQESRNNRKLLEFAELGEKMRRTYLRLSRIVKVDSEPTSAKEEADQNGQPALSPEETHSGIHQVFRG